MHIKYIAPCILNLQSRFKTIISFMLLLLYPQKKKPPQLCALGRWLCGQIMWYVHCGEERNLCVCKDFDSNCPAYSKSDISRLIVHTPCFCFICDRYHMSEFYVVCTCSMKFYHDVYHKLSN